MVDYFTGYQNTTPQTSLADMMNIANSAQQYKQAQALNPLALQAKQMEIQQAQAVNPLELQIKQLAVQQAQALNPIAQKKAQLELDQLTRTYPDLADKIASEAALAKTQATTAAGTSAPTISEAQSKAGTAALGLNTAKLENIQAQYRGGARMALDLIGPNVKYQDVVDKITGFMKRNGAGDDAVKQFVDSFPKTDDPTILNQQLSNLALKSLNAHEEINKRFPSATLVSTGGAVVPTNIENPVFSGKQPGELAGKSIAMTLPPGQTFVDEKGAKFILGANGQRQYTDVGPATSAAQTALGTVSGSDYASTVADANAATNTRSIYDKIRSALPLAFTGVGSDKKQFLSKLAQAIGIPANTLETTNTEELVKNSKLLQVVGGNTDAARAIAELANPSASMTLAGNQKIIEQLDGQEKFKEEKAHFLEPVAGDPAAYQQRLRQWNSAADPLFFTEMTQEDAAQVMRTMSVARKAELLKKRERAKALGIIP